MKELLKQFNLPNYLKGDSFAADSKRISERTRGKKNEHSSQEDLATEQDLLGRLKEAQEFVKQTQEAIEQPQQQNQMFMGGAAASGGGFMDMFSSQFGGQGQGAMGIAPEIAGGAQMADAGMPTNPQEPGAGLGAKAGGAAGIIGQVGEGAGSLVQSFDKSQGGYQNEALAGVGGALKGAGKGAQLGMMAGPMGAAIGAGVGLVAGGVSGLIGSKKKNERAKQDNGAAALRQANAQSNFALGGEPGGGCGGAGQPPCPDLNQDDMVKINAQQDAPLQFVQDESGVAAMNNLFQAPPQVDKANVNYGKYGDVNYFQQSASDPTGHTLERGAGANMNDADFKKRFQTVQGMNPGMELKMNAMGGSVGFATHGKNIQNRFNNGGDPTKPNTATQLDDGNVDLNGTVLTGQGQNALLQKKYEHNAANPYLGKYGGTYAGKDGMEAKGAGIMSYDNGFVNFNSKYNRDTQEQYMDKVRGLPENKGRNIYLQGSQNPAYMAPRDYNNGVATTTAAPNQFATGGDPTKPPKKSKRFDWAEEVTNLFSGSNDTIPAETLSDVRSKGSKESLMAKHGDLFKSIAQRKKADNDVFVDNTQNYAEADAAADNYFGEAQKKVHDKNKGKTGPKTKATEANVNNDVTETVADASDILSFDEAREAGKYDGSNFLDYVNESRTFNPDQGPRLLQEAMQYQTKGLSPEFSGEFQADAPLTRAEQYTAPEEAGWQDGVKDKFNDLFSKENPTLANLGRMAPSLMNAYQLAKLSKPEQQASSKLTGRVEGQRIDEQALQNMVREQNAGTREAIKGSSGGSGSAARANLLAANKQGNSALSDAYLKAQGHNQSEVARAQQMNRQADQVNLQQSNRDQEANARNRAAYQNNKSKLLNQIGSDIGAMSKESLLRKYPFMMGMDYDSYGKYIKDQKKNKKNVK